MCHATANHGITAPGVIPRARLIPVGDGVSGATMKLLTRLLALQLLAVVVALAGELVASDPLVTAGVATFFVALALMFVQMTAALVAGLRRSDRRASVR